jgi:hypothetical protein
VKGAAAHPEVAPQASRCRGHRRVANWVVAVLGTYRENGDAGDDSGLPALIPSTGRKREARQSFGRARLLAGRRLAAGRGGGHGGSDGHARGEENKREGERAERWSG